MPQLNRFDITPMVLFLVGAMAWLLFPVLGVSEAVGAAILVVWIILIGYIGGKVFSKHGST